MVLNDSCQHDDYTKIMRRATVVREKVVSADGDEVVSGSNR